MTKNLDTSLWESKMDWIVNLAQNELERKIGKQLAGVTNWNNSPIDDFDAPYSATVYEGQKAILKIDADPGHKGEYDGEEIRFFGFDPRHADVLAKVANTIDYHERIVNEKGPLDWHGVCIPGRYNIGRFIKEHKEFKEKQEEIYGKFQKSMKEISRGNEEIIPSPALEKGQSGHAILLRHDSAIMDKITEISDQINQVIPSITYNESNIHTTAIVFDVKDGKQDYDKKTLERLSYHLNMNSDNSISRLVNPIIDFSSRKFRYYVETNQNDKTNYAFNKDSVILLGDANISYTDMVQNVLKRDEKLKLDYAGRSSDHFPELKPAWGSHITVARFKEKVTTEQVKELENIISKAPDVGESIVDRVVLGSFYLDSSGFNLDIYKSLDIMY